jgi:hypothetical protein
MIGQRVDAGQAGTGRSGQFSAIGHSLPSPENTEHHVASTTRWKIPINGVENGIGRHP